MLLGSPGISILMLGYPTSLHKAKAETFLGGKKLRKLEITNNEIKKNLNCFFMFFTLYNKKQKKETARLVNQTRRGTSATRVG